MIDSERIQLHPSGLNVFDECGERWRRMYEVGERSGSNEYLIVGNAVDEAVMADLRSKLTCGELLSEKYVEEIAVHYVRSAYRRAHMVAGIDLSILRAIRFSLYAHKVLNPKIQVVGVQEPWSVRLDDMLKRRGGLEDRWAKIDLVGTLDIREHYYDFSSPTEPVGYVIRDLKTAKASPPGDAADGKHWLQLTSYALGCFTIHGQMPARVQIDTLVSGKGDRVEHKPSFGERTDKDFAALFNRAVRFAQARRAGLYLPAPRGHWRCSKEWCQFYSSCPYTKNAQTIDLAPSPLREYKLRVLEPPATKLKRKMVTRREHGTEQASVQKEPIQEERTPHD